MLTVETIRAEIDRLASFHCPAYEPSLFGNPGDEHTRHRVSDVHRDEHPTRRSCAAAIVANLFSLEIRVRGIAWSYHARPAIGEQLNRIREVIGRLEEEHALPLTPYWTLDQVIAGGPGYERRWPGYTR